MQSIEWNEKVEKVFGVGPKPFYTEKMVKYGENNFRYKPMAIGNFNIV